MNSELSNFREELYKKTIDELVKGGRALVRLNENELAIMASELEAHLHSPNELRQILCILDHCITQSDVLEAPIFKLMNSELDNELHIFALSVFQKQVITRYQKEGHPLSPEILNVLKNLLKHKNMDVREWTLRVCESVGKQNLKLKAQILESRPKVFLFKSESEKNCIELIELMQKQWKAIGL